MGMAESVRSSSEQWNCFGSHSQDWNNIAANSKTGTATSGWFKPDLLAPAANITSSRSSDTSTTDFCINGTTPPPLPSAYLASTGTSFAAPAAAGAALLAGRYYAARVGGNASSASPALLKAMLIAGARSMRNGINRSGAPAWRPQTTMPKGDLLMPRSPNGSIYKIRNLGESSTVEPNWPPSGSITENGSRFPVTYDWEQLESGRTIGGFPNDQQGFGRLHLEDVLSRYPSRDLLSSVPAPTVGSSTWWSKTYRVHDRAAEVRVVIAWTDPPANIPSGQYIEGPPLVNDLDLRVERGMPCVARYIGNSMTADLSDGDSTCSSVSHDRKNNVEMIRFYALEGTDLFRVEVGRQAGEGAQDFALVVYNAYIDGTPIPPVPASNFKAEAVSTTSVALSWDPVPNASTYEVQRTSSISAPFVTIYSQSATAPTSHVDSDGLTPATTYIYRLRAVNSPVVSVTGPEIATTILFPDDPIQAGVTPVRASHINSLRNAALAVRSAAGLPTYSWSEAITALSTIIRAEHFTELRAAIDAARQAIGLTLNPYSEPLLPVVTTIRAIHMDELRKGVR